MADCMVVINEKLSNGPDAGLFFGKTISIAIRRGNVASVLGTFPVDSNVDDFFDALWIPLPIISRLYIIQVPTEKDEQKEAGPSDSIESWFNGNHNSWVVNKKKTEEKRWVIQSRVIIYSTLKINLNPSYDEKKNWFVIKLKCNQSVKSGGYDS